MEQEVARKCDLRSTLFAFIEDGRRVERRAMPGENHTPLNLEIAHILFIDVVGYSKLLMHEQAGYLQSLNSIVLATEQVRAADSHLIRLPTGDGMALVFRKAPEAPVRCALEIASGLKEHPGIQVRMGVHSGPVSEVADVNQRANIAGAGINLAQRVMDCGDAGHILLSKRVAEDLAQTREWQPLLHELGEVEVKHGVKISLVNLYTPALGNPAAPQKVQHARDAQLRATRGASRQRLALAGLVLVALLALVGAAWWSAERKNQVASPADAPAAAANSIAVLPLENLSDDKANAFFADGIQDDVLTSLAKIKGLKVISRTSVMSYRSKAARNLRTIGRELGPAHVLEGSVRRVGDRVLVNVQLIDTATDQHIWAEHYDRTLKDSLTLQGELAAEIAVTLSATLSPEEKARVETKPTDNPDAYVAYLRGREFQLRPEVTRENYLSAESFYQQAVALDPRFVLARARLSYVQGWFYTMFESENPARLAEARKNAEEALRLDANSAEAHLALARCAQEARDEPTTRRELAAAVRLLPGDASVALGAALTQESLGWDEEAIASYQRAAELGPREPKVFYNYGLLLDEVGRRAEARVALDHALALAPESVYFRLSRARSEIIWSGDIAAARKILAAIPAGQDPDGRITSARCYLAILERDFPAALGLLRAYPGESLPGLLDAGFGTSDAKIEGEGYIALFTGDRSRAGQCFASVREKYVAAARDNPESGADLASLAFIDALTGAKDQALLVAARVIELEASQNIPPKGRSSRRLAHLYAWSGELDLAWGQVRKIVAAVPPDWLAHDFRLNPLWDPLRQDPRFQSLLKTQKP